MRVFENKVPEIVLIGTTILNIKNSNAENKSTSN